MTELEKLKKMLVSAHDELRARKQKNTPTFGAMMFMLQAIVQCNAALNERSVNPLIRIAKALEEILRLVKKDMNANKK